MTALPLTRRPRFQIAGQLNCKVCGATLESWLESTHVPTFELVKRPDRKPA